MSTEAKVTRIPLCDICRVQDAAYDGKTIHGPWAYMCQPCHDAYGIGLGTGRGQRLILAELSSH
jgi:hypothetical protein